MKLPKHFAIKKDADNPLWDKYISWLNDYAMKNGYNGNSWSGCLDAYYGVTDIYDCGNTGWHYQLKTFPEGTVELTLEEWDEIVNGFEFPEKWYCVVTPENKQMLNEWKNSKSTFLRFIEVNENELILSYHPDGSYYYGDEEREFLDRPHFSGYKKITTEQFIKYVLKKKEIKDTILKEGDIVELLGIKYWVRKGLGWYLSSFPCNNNEIFIKLGLNKKDFQIQILGYYVPGKFPECETAEDLTKFVTAIQEEILKQEKQKEMKNRKISPSDAQRIINIACENWKQKLAANWGFNIAMSKDIEILEDFYQEMRKDCTKWQHELFDEIFGKDVEVYPDGTPCLVSSARFEGWNLRYANGKGGFYNGGRKSGISSTWPYHMKLDINNLPVNR